VVIKTLLGAVLAVFAAAGFAAAWRFGRRDDLLWFLVGMAVGPVALALAVLVLTSESAAPDTIPSASPAPPVSTGSPA
jgi:ABC-type glycerol-3-phosphate transport system permease component